MSDDKPGEWARAEAAKACPTDRGDIEPDCRTCREIEAALLAAYARGQREENEACEAAVDGKHAVREHGGTGKLMAVWNDAINEACAAIAARRKGGRG